MHGHNTRAGDTAEGIEFLHLLRGFGVVVLVLGVEQVGNGIENHDIELLGLNVLLQGHELRFVGQVDTLPVVEDQCFGVALADTRQFRPAQAAIAIGKVPGVFRVNVEDAQGSIQPESDIPQQPVQTRHERRCCR